MKQQPDKLFQDKLSGYERQAPAAAWDRLEQRLDKKQPKALWWKVAAVLIAVAISVPVALILNEKSSSNIAHTEKDRVSPKEKPSAKSEPSIAVQEQPDALTEERTTPTTTLADLNSTKQDVIKPSPEASVLENSTMHRTSGISIPEEVVTQNDDAIVREEIENHSESHEEPVIANVESKQNQSITLVISAEEATNYYEEEKLFDDTDATSDTKKPSTFQKLLRKASDLKTNQDPFGELRQKKNEILALNFKSDKKRNQKIN